MIKKIKKWRAQRYIHKTYYAGLHHLFAGCNSIKEVKEKNEVFSKKLFSELGYEA